LGFIYDILKNKQDIETNGQIARDARKNTPGTNMIETLSIYATKICFIYFGGKMIEFLQQVLNQKYGSRFQIRQQKIAT